MNSELVSPSIEIRTIRDRKVILDTDLAKAYGVETRLLNQQVKRNQNRFPEDFAFQLTVEEMANLKSQIVTSSLGRSGHGGKRKLPLVFTEHGVIMAASVLNSEQAVSMSVFIVRAFVRMRENMMQNAEILKRLAEIDQTLLKHDETLLAIWQRLQPLLHPPTEPPRKKIGFKS